MVRLSRRKKLIAQEARLRPIAANVMKRGATQDVIIDGYAPAQMIEDLRKYQSELEIQNQALRYSQQEAEGASERFATLFSNVPLALMVVDEDGLVLASNAMALRLFQPLESDPPLNFLLPFVGATHADEVAVAFINARTAGTSEVNEVEFLAGAQGRFTGDLHIARIDNPLDNLAHFICAVIDQGPLLAERKALQKAPMCCASAMRTCCSARNGWQPSSTPRWTPFCASTRTSASPFSIPLRRHSLSARLSKPMAARWPASFPMCRMR